MRHELEKDSHLQRPETNGAEGSPGSKDLGLGHLPSLAPTANRGGSGKQPGDCCVFNLSPGEQQERQH